MNPFLENSGKCKLINSNSRLVVAKEWRKKALITKGYSCSGTKGNFYWCFIVHYLDDAGGIVAVYMCRNLSNHILSICAKLYISKVVYNF